MKKFTAFVICFVLILSFPGCGSEPEQIANPWKDWNSLKDAEEEIGFAFGLPETIADSYVAGSFRTMSGETPLIEVTYSDPEYTVVIRKAIGEDTDISGVYDHNLSDTEEWRNGEEISYYRTREGSLKIIFNHDGYSWSVYAPNGFWGDSCNDFLIAIFE